jgi:hypothetical protein
VTNLAQYLAAPVQWPQLRPGINRLAGTEAERARGYNKIAFTGTAGTDATMNVLYYPADLM